MFGAVSCYLYHNNGDGGVGNIKVMVVLVWMVIVGGDGGGGVWGRCVVMVVLVWMVVGGGGGGGGGRCGNGCAGVDDGVMVGVCGGVDGC